MTKVPSKYPSLHISSRAEIEAAVGPYIVSRWPVSDPKWREIYERECSKQKRAFLRQKFRQWIPWKRNARPQTKVSSHYETHWSRVPWPSTHQAKPGDKTTFSIWDDEGMVIRHYGRKRAHHLVFSELVKTLKPKTALEVGCGNGINLLVLAALFPDVQWSGVELTEAGVAVGQSIQQEAELPSILQDFAIKPVVDATAHRRVEIQQGDASALPFPDRAFDLVFSFQALEQMQSIRDKAVSEMARVTRQHVICTEPFAEFNTLQIQKHYKEALNYLDLSISELPAFGLDPFFVFEAWPHRLVTGAGLVAAERRA